MNRSITTKEVRDCYRYILGREGESEAAIELHRQTAQSLQTLRENFIYSEEFIRRYFNVQYGIVEYNDGTFSRNIMWCVDAKARDEISDTIKTGKRLNEAYDVYRVAEAIMKKSTSNPHGGGGIA